MKLGMVVNGNGIVNEYSLSGGDIYFALCSNVANGGKQITPFFRCRDYFNDVMYNYYKGSKFLYLESVAGNRDLLDLKKLRLIITNDFKSYGSAAIKEWEHNLYVAKSIINLYEELAGFKKKSVLVEITHSDTRIKRCWQLLGPKEWMDHSHLLSMVTLIFRCVIRAQNTVLNIPKSLEEAEKMMAELHRFCMPHTDYTVYLPTCLPLFSPLMKNLNKVFTMAPEEIYRSLPAATTRGLWHSYGGINSLCKADTTVKKLDDGIKRLRKESRASL